MTQEKLIAHISVSKLEDYIYEPEVNQNDLV